MKGPNEAGDDQVRGNGKKRVPASSADEQPAPKRSRVSRACDQCRASREKCDGTQPVCQTCESQRRACTYYEQPKKRGIQPNYIRTLELMLAWLFRSYSGSEGLLATILASADDATQKVLSGKDSFGTDLLHQAWRDSIVCKQIDQMLSGATVDKPVEQNVANAGYSSVGATLPVQEQSSSHVPQIPKAMSNGAERSISAGSHAPELRREASYDFGVVLDPQLDTASKAVADADIPVRHKLPIDSWTFFEYYFAFTHAWLPVTDKQEMLKLMYTFPGDGLTEEEMLRVPAYAELWSALALAAQQIPGHTADEALHRVALNLIPSGEGPYEPCHIKALLLLGVLEMARNEWIAAWLLVGTAVRFV